MKRIHYYSSASGHRDLQTLKREMYLVCICTMLFKMAFTTLTYAQHPETPNEKGIFLAFNHRFVSYCPTTFALLAFRWTPWDSKTLKKCFELVSVCFIANLYPVISTLAGLTDYSGSQYGRFCKREGKCFQPAFSWLQTSIIYSFYLSRFNHIKVRYTRQSVVNHIKVRYTRQSVV